MVPILLDFDREDCTFFTDDEPPSEELEPALDTCLLIDAALLGLLDNCLDTGVLEGDALDEDLDTNLETDF